jgi:3-oxoacyl-[acyl-carrier-protein] synthase-3
MTTTTIPQSEAQLTPTTGKRSIIGVRIAATGAYLPARIVTNRDLSHLGCDEQWIQQRTGILQRHHAAVGESTSDMAFQAARRCLSAAGVHPSDVDLLIVATMTPDHYTPSASAVLQGRLGCRAPAMDLNAACSGFMYGLITAAQFVKSGSYQRALVIGADVMSHVVDPHDKKTYPLFGDGAGAALVTLADEGSDPMPGLLGWRLAAEGDLGHLICVPAGGSREPISAEVVASGRHYLEMNGKPVFKWAVRLIPRVIDDVLEACHLSLDDIDLFIPHQANCRIIDAAIQEMNIDRDKVFVNLDRYGNTSAASIPIALNEAIAQGRVAPHSRVLLCGFGAGLTWGACVYQT